MMEESGIRCIPVEERQTIMGYRKENELVTYHHIIPKAKGGRETEENGVLLKWYNHRWLHSQPKDVQDKVNAKLQEYKIAIAKIEDEKINGFVLDFDFDDCIQIPLFPTNPERYKEMER